MAKRKDRVKLGDDDWKVLFPGEDFAIGSTTLRIEPLSLKGLSVVVDKLSRIIHQVVELDIDLDHLERDADKIVNVVHLVVNEAPEILSEMSGLDKDDVAGLPIDLAVDLFNKCLDVNIASQESLTKNFKSLGDRLVKFMGSPTSATQAPNEELGVQSNI